MKCPYCASIETKVIDKRESEDCEVTRRRRECLKCSKRFTTYERVNSVDLIIIKRNKDRENFSSEKLKVGIMKACEKRPVSVEAIEKMIEKIESELRKMEGTEIESKVIGEMTMEMLKKTDEVAYVRFASVYRQFKNPKEFIKKKKNLQCGV